MDLLVEGVRVPMLFRHHRDVVWSRKRKKSRERTLIKVPFDGEEKANKLTRIPIKEKGESAIDEGPTYLQ